MVVAIELCIAWIRCIQCSGLCVGVTKHQSYSNKGTAIYLPNFTTFRSFAYRIRFYVCISCCHFCALPHVTLMSLWMHIPISRSFFFVIICIFPILFLLFVFALYDIVIWNSLFLIHEKTTKIIKSNQIWLVDSTL